MGGFRDGLAIVGLPFSRYIHTAFLLFIMFSPSVLTLSAGFPVFIRTRTTILIKFPLLKDEKKK